MLLQVLQNPILIISLFPDQSTRCAAWSINVAVTLVNSSLLPVPSPMTSMVDVVEVTGGILQVFLQPFLLTTATTSRPALIL